MMKRRMSFRLLLAATLVLAVWGVPAMAETLMVPNTAFPTIQDAIDAANPGDAIVVKKGVYKEDLTLLTDNIELRGGGCKTIIEGIGFSTEPFPVAVPNIDIKANGVRITQFTIRDQVPTEWVQLNYKTP
jgi:pectin methylesterase-like acyl-CoA thioesterase